MTAVFSPLPLGLLEMLGNSELLVIFLVILLLFGGKKMPEFARGLAKSLREFRKAANSVEQEFKRALDEEEVQTTARRQGGAAADATEPTIMPPAPGGTVARTADTAADSPAGDEADGANADRHPPADEPAPKTEAPGSVAAKPVRPGAPADHHAG